MELKLLCHPQKHFGFTLLIRRNSCKADMQIRSLQLCSRFFNDISCFYSSRLVDFRFFDSVLVTSIDLDFILDSRIHIICILTGINCENTTFKSLHVVASTQYTLDQSFQYIKLPVASSLA